MTRRGTTTITITRRSLPQKSERTGSPRQERRSSSANYKRMVPAMRECTHSCASIPSDTPRQGWF